MILDHGPKKGEVADWVGHWEAGLGPTTIRMSLEPDGSADFNGVPGTWAYADGKLIIGDHDGTVHQFAATFQGATLTLVIDGLPQPLAFERAKSSVPAEDLSDRAGTGAGGLLGVWEDTQGHQVTLRADGTMLDSGAATRYRVDAECLILLGDDGEIPLPYELHGDTLSLGVGENRLELRRQGDGEKSSQKATKYIESAPDAGESATGYTDEDAKAIEEEIHRQNAEERRKAQIVGLMTHGHSFTRSLYLLAQRAHHTGLLQEQFLEASRLFIAWLEGERLTDRADEDERRAQAALDLLKAAGDEGGMHRLAARSIMALPEGHPLRDVDAAREALVKQLEFCRRRTIWNGWVSTLQSLIEYDFVLEERLPEAIATAERILAERPAEERRRFRIIVLKHHGENVIRARDARDDVAFQESLDKAEAQMRLLSADGGGEAPMSADDLQLIGLVKELAGKTSEAAEIYARALAAGEISVGVGRSTARREAVLRVRAGEFTRAIELLVPMMSTLEDDYLTAVEDGAVQSTGREFCLAAEDLAYSLASLGRWDEALSMLDHAKSLRLRYRAALRETEAGKDILALERALYAAARGGDSDGLRFATVDRDPIGNKLTRPAHYLEMYREARPRMTYELLSSPSIAEIAGSLHEDEAVAILGVHHAAMLMAVIFPNDAEVPGAHHILADWPRKRLWDSMGESRRGWGYVMAAPPGYAECTHREALSELVPRLDQSLGAPLAEMLEGRRVCRLAIIPHHFLHVVPFWVLPSLSAYQVTLAPSAAHFKRSRASRPSAARTTLAVVDPTLDLPLSPAEADAMDQHLGASGWTAKRLARGAAQEGNVVEALEGVAILHFSGHGRSDALNPTKSSLLLHPDLDRFAPLGADPLGTLAASVGQWSHDPWQGIHASFPGLGRLYQIRYDEVNVTERSLEYSETGTLWYRYHGETLTHRAELWRAGDIMVEGALKDCRLAFLSSCDSGGVWNVRSSDVDEFAGLPAALLLAGVGAVLASLWPVDDVTTALYVDKFYAALAQATGPVDLAALTRDVAEDLRGLTREGAAQRLMDLRERTTDPKARFRLEAAAQRIAVGVELPFGSPYDWGAFYLTGASEIDFSSEDDHDKS